MICPAPPHTLLHTEGKEMGLACWVGMVQEEQAEPETHEICRVTKFGNWEFERPGGICERTDEALPNWPP